MQNKHIRIVGIETSCDETALCVIEAEGDIIRVLANTVLSQARLHAAYGGVFPSLAKREHIKNLPLLLPLVLKEVGLAEENPRVDKIAVTTGPGLEPCLWAGITFAETLGKKWGVPIVGVNHMEGHIYSALLRPLREKSCFSLRTPCFPALALLISGGHTELDVIENYGKYRLLGETRDDAVGEAFDKVARLLGLPYPGGPEISRLAEEARWATKNPPPNPPPLEKEGGKGGGFSIMLPRPMLHSGDYDFSFSGIKTAVLYLIKKMGVLDEKTKQSIALEFETAITEVLIAKTKRALRETNARTLIVAGGVIANAYIRSQCEKLATEERVELLIPAIAHTTDNALMIAVASYASPTSHTTQELRASGRAKINEL
jgi:N6-L-threonylcarbamoyladenine synthase